MVTRHVIQEGFKGEKAIITPYTVRDFQATNAITRQLHVTHIGYYPKANYHYRQRQSGASENILIYCDNGKGWISCNNQHLELVENQLFIIPANTKHSYGANEKDPWSIYWIHFKGENTPMFESIFGKVMRFEISDKSRLGDRIQLFEEIFHNLEMGYKPENLEYITFCLMHFLASIKYVPQYQEVKKIKESDIIQKCILYMKDNLENKISLNEIAQNIGYSSSHLNSLFTQRTSFSPIEYFNQLKIQRACSYLQFSELKIKEIAFRLKYYDQFHFSKAFASEMGISPKEYRKRYNDKIQSN